MYVVGQKYYPYYIRERSRRAQPVESWDNVLVNLEGLDMQLFVTMNTALDWLAICATCDCNSKINK